MRYLDIAPFGSTLALSPVTLREFQVNISLHFDQKFSVISVISPFQIPGYIKVKQRLTIDVFQEFFRIVMFCMTSRIHV